MDIVLNTRFNNPALPKVPLPGFYDDFGPAGGPPSDSTLGTTSRENRPWEYNGDPWSRTSDQTALPPYGFRGVAYTNGYSTDGTLSVTLHKTAGEGQFGVAFRYANPDNFNYFAFNATLGYFFVNARVNGDGSVIADTYTPPAAPVAGDTMTVIMQGPNIYCYHNDTEAIITDTTANEYATRHGLYNHTHLPEEDRTQFSNITFSI